MNYLNRITEVPSDVQVLIPLFGDVVIIYEEIMDGGSASDFFYPEVIDGGRAGNVLNEEITGGDASSFEQMDYSSTHSLVFKHTATHKSYSYPCKLIDKTDINMLLEVRFKDVPEVGQYHLRLLQKDIEEPLYVGMVEMVNNRQPMPQYNHNNEITQYQ